ncbi:MAG: glycosyltransferase [Bacilli bacterium]
MKVLQILPTLNRCGGVESYIMNYYREILKRDIVFDFMINDVGNNNYIEEVKENGSNVYVLPKLSVKNISKIKKIANEIISKGNYDVVHCHTANAAFIYLKIAKKNNVTVRALHSHQSKAADKLSHQLRNYPLLYIGKKYANLRIACSKLAGDFLFKNKNYYIINNAINEKKYIFNKNIRVKLRKELCIANDTFVIGNIGRFTNQKNQIFLLKIVQELVSKHNLKCKCILIGDGELSDILHSYVETNKLSDIVIFPGVISNTYDYYNAFDIFVLPSLYEGLPVVGVEAQYNGLHIVTSTSVTKELNFSGNTHYLSLTDGPQKWAKFIIDNIHSFKRENVTSDTYSIENQCESLLELYKQADLK